MKVIPMLFKTELVLALLEGRKTVTRRHANLSKKSIKQGVSLSDIKKVCRSREDHLFSAVLSDKFDHIGTFDVPCRVGDLIYVRETFMPDPDADHDSWDEHELSYFEWAGCDSSPQFLPEALKTNEYCIYKANGPVDGRWIPSIHMPRWANRITLKVTDVRIERVKEITEEQAMREGCNIASATVGVDEKGWCVSEPRFFFGSFKSSNVRPSAKEAFRDLWRSIYCDWFMNPYVWVIEFEVIHKNIDQVISEMEAEA